MGQSKHYTKGIDSKGTLSYRIVTNDLHPVKRTES